MATATITIKDNEDGSVNIRLDCDPPIDMKDDAQGTPAQYAAVQMIASIQSDPLTASSEVVH